MNTTDSKRDPYQFEDARVAGSQETDYGVGPVEINGMAVERYRRLAGEFHHPYARRNQVNVGQGERMASVLAGLALATYGLKLHSSARVALAAAGGALVFRGVTGHCPINSAVGRNSAA